MKSQSKGFNVWRSPLATLSDLVSQGNWAGRLYNLIQSTTTINRNFYNILESRQRGLMLDNLERESIYDVVGDSYKEIIIGPSVR